MISSFIISAFDKANVTEKGKRFVVCSPARPHHKEGDVTLEGERRQSVIGLSSGDATVFNNAKGIPEPIRVKEAAEKKFPDHKFKIHGLDFDYKGD